MTPIEQRLLAGEQITFHEALYDACMHGELTEEQAREWLDGDDLVLALRVIKSGRFLERPPEVRAWMAKMMVASERGELAKR